MVNTLPTRPNIDLLKKRAKKLVKQFREQNSDALALVETWHPKPKNFKNLRDAQLVIARSFGFNSWAELSDAVELAQYQSRSLADQANLLIQLSCSQYQGHDNLRNYQQAEKLLANNPSIASFSLYTALVSHNLDKVKHILNDQPALANEPGGPLNWQPLLYVTYNRINDKNQNALKILQLLLEHGANADAHVTLNETYHFTALTGAMGEGEAGIHQPPHQYSEEIALLLLEHGASPNESQGLYNTMFTESIDKWLALLVKFGLNNEHHVNWLSEGNNQTTFDFILCKAIKDGVISRVQYLLDKGANANAIDQYDYRPIYTNALLMGHHDIAELLLANGANAQQLSTEEQFKIACIDQDSALIEQFVAHHPHIKDNHTLLHDVAYHCDTKVFHQLIRLGFDINGQAYYGRTVLHHFSFENNVKEVEYLLQQGAKTDIKESSYQNTPLGFAAYNNAKETMRLLLDHSGSFLDAVCCGYFDRAQTLLNHDPTLIQQQSPNGNFALHLIGVWLIEEIDYNTCENFVRMLITAGADINARNNNNQTAKEFYVANNYDTQADILSNEIDNVNS